MIEDEVYQEYGEYLETASIVHMKDLATGDIQRRLAPKRGNRAYARKQEKKMRDLESGFKGLVFDRPLPGRNHKACHMFLSTLTYDQKNISKEDAWKNISHDIKSMKVMLSRALHAEHIDVLTVKEGTESGYPAPHLLVIVDRPVICVRHKNRRGEITYRLADHVQLGKVKQTWKNGFLDIKAVVNNKVGAYSAVHYTMKYLVKSVDAKKKDLAFKQMAWQKKFNLRAMHIGQSFKNLVNPVRLETILNESQQVKGHMWVFDHIEYIKLSDFDKIMMRKVETVRKLPNKMHHSSQT